MRAQLRSAFSKVLHCKIWFLLFSFTQEVNTNVSVVDDTPNEEVHAMSTRKTLRRSVAEKGNKSCPSPKRRCERESTASNVVVREQVKIFLITLYFHTSKICYI